jgi:hypothetical protein
MPGAVVIPQNYGESMVLYSSMPIAVVVDGARPGKKGRLFELEAGRSTKVPFEAGRFILDHLPYTGVVRVDEIETETGIEYNIQKAREESEAMLSEQDEKRFHQFVTDCVEDFIKRNKPVPQPPQPILDIIHRRGYDLKKYGIVPIGWEDPEKSSRVTQLEEQVGKLQEMLAASDRQALETRVRELEAQNTLLLSQNVTKKEGKHKSED